MPASCRDVCRGVAACNDCIPAAVLPPGSAWLFPYGERHPFPCNRSGPFPDAASAGGRNVGLCRIAVIYYDGAARRFCREPGVCIGLDVCSAGCRGRDLFADEGRCVYVRTARCGEGGVSAAARQGDGGAAGGRKHETAVPDGPVDTCGARGMDGQRFPFEKVRERDVRSAGGRDVRKHRTGDADDGGFMPAVDGGVVPVADAERIAHDFGLYAVDDVLVCGDFRRPLVGLSYQYGDAGRCRNLFESADFPALGNRFFRGTDAAVGRMGSAAGLALSLCRMT